MWRTRWTDVKKQWCANPAQANSKSKALRKRKWEKVESFNLGAVIINKMEADTISSPLYSGIKSLMFKTATLKGWDVLFQLLTYSWESIATPINLSAQTFAHGDTQQPWKSVSSEGDRPDLPKEDKSSAHRTRIARPIANDGGIYGPHLRVRGKHI